MSTGQDIQEAAAEFAVISSELAGRPDSGDGASLIPTGRLVVWGLRGVRVVLQNEAITLALVVLAVLLGIAAGAFLLREVARE